ncbi:hypothetical protein BDB00DRAFT_212319 [Zychaea mexicana]|uniref:uncharacterized protein n=1 Tax=Zychaea mexicana TaxID=64656 RepID=UPI0022FEE185|nr:uncharacterized protein BDB00DRAFT_212319 [Zychaea mexicana]KAI9495706.1 hypothetical protein BDB00DRAFT_212319 [Zychaea mexicana]
MVRISVAILPCAAVLLSAVTSSSARQMSKRAVSTIFTSCPLDQSSYAGRTIAQYSAYLIKGVYLPSGTLFNGPLGLKGTYQNSEVTFGAARYTNCNATETSFITVNENGLVISGEDGNKDVYVTGSELVSTNGEVDLSNGCSSLYLTNSYDLQFNIITDSMITASLRLASLTPNMYMDATGNIVDKGSEDDTYKVFTFNTCNNGACNIAGDLSDPAGIFGGENNYEGPTGDVPSPDATVVFNIPVDQKGSFNINNPAVSNGFYACRTIYNFYPVTTSGDYRPKGSFYLLRNTANLEGITLAPLGKIAT